MCDGVDDLVVDALPGSEDAIVFGVVAAKPPVAADLVLDAREGQEVDRDGLGPPDAKPLLDAGDLRIDMVEVAAAQGVARVALVERNPGTLRLDRDRRQLGLFVASRQREADEHEPP